MAKLLIKKADFEGRIDVSVNLDAAKKLNQHILHAQDFDLRGVMGDRFYYFFMSQFDEAGALKAEASDQVKNLYNGSEYTVEETTWNNPGIKPVLVYFAGARLIKGIDQHITPNGFASKVNEFSEPISNGRKVFQAVEYENQAQSYWNMVQTFLEHDKALFPQYFGDGCGCTPQTRKRPRTIAVGNLNHY
jgi:hypothetical protein